MSRPDLSVVVVNWNAGDHLTACLTSLAAAGDGLDLQVLVVDNASDDDSLARACAAHPSIEPVESATNLGFGRGVQIGVERSRSDFVAVVNPDVVLRPGSLAAMVRFLEDHAAAGVVAPRTLGPDGRPAGGGEPLPGLGSAFAFFPLLGRHKRRRKQRSRSQEVTALAGWVRGACMVFRHQALLDIGGFPTETFMYGEEILVGHRLARTGWQVWYLPTVTVDHRKGVSTRRRWSPEETILQAHRGRLRAMRVLLGAPRHALWCLIATIGLSIQAAARQLGLGGQPEYPYAALFSLHASALLPGRPRR